jgi:hypothetical protein
VKKFKLISLVLILLINCSNEEAAELERCKSTFKGIQEAYLQLGEIYPDEEAVEVKFGDIYGGLQDIWFYYAVQNFNDQILIDTLKDDETFNEELWDEIDNIDTRDQFNLFIDRPISELLIIKSNIEALEPDLNNITNHGEVVRSINQMIKATEDLKTDFPEVPKDFEELGDDIVTNYDIALDYGTKTYGELSEIELTINFYSQCSTQE